MLAVRTRKLNPTSLSALKTIKGASLRSASCLAERLGIAMANGSAFDFQVHSAASPFAFSQQKYLDLHPDTPYKYIATGALVFDIRDPQTRRILLLQRSGSDSMPGRWEIPGGACDDEDESILHGVARELWEEASLKAIHIGPAVGEPYIFSTKSGKRIAKFCFIVEAEQDAGLEVRLDPNEHQHFAWASEHEVKANKVGDAELEFTAKELQRTVLQAFHQFDQSTVTNQ